MHQRTYRKVSSADPVTPTDLRSILDTHGVRIAKNVGKGEEARELRRLYRGWINQQGIRPDLTYVMPLRVLLELLLASHGGRINERGLYAWRVLADALNDPDAGLQIVQRRYTSRRAA